MYVKYYALGQETLTQQWKELSSGFKRFLINISIIWLINELSTQSTFIAMNES